MAYDHIEPFRPWIDKMLIEMFMSRQLTDKHFEMEENEQHIMKQIIAPSGRKILVDAFFDLMNQRAYLNGKRIKLNDHIHFLSKTLVNKLKNYENDTAPNML